MTLRHFYSDKDKREDTMSRREMREHIFRLIFRMDFHPEDEMIEQEELYLDPERRNTD